jgi:hypothetical protein
MQLPEQVLRMRAVLGLGFVNDHRLIMPLQSLPRDQDLEEWQSPAGHYFAPACAEVKVIV